MPRMFVCLSLALVALIAVCFLAPQQGPVILYKATLVLLAGWGGYWLDRWAFPYARPDSYLESGKWEEDHAISGGNGKCDDADHPVVDGYQTVFAAAMLRRAAIIGAAMLAVGLGL